MLTAINALQSQAFMAQYICEPSHRVVFSAALKYPEIQKGDLSFKNVVYRGPARRTFIRLSLRLMTVRVM